MSPTFWIVTLAIALLTGALSLVLWILVRAAAVLDRREAEAADAAIELDQFSPSMHRFGYVQDARNRGDI